MSHNCFRGLIACLLAGFVAGVPAEPRLAAASQGTASASPIQERLNRIREGLFSGTGRVSDAIQELKEILAIDPGSAEGHLSWGSRTGARVLRSSRVKRSPNFARRWR